MCRRAVALGLMVIGRLAAADVTCEPFKWDIARERALFAAPAAAPSPGDASPPATIADDMAVELALAPQARVRFVAPPAKPTLPDGAYAGVATFSVATAGLYRVAVDGPYWLDVLDASIALESRDFGGPRGDCPPPRKVVVYELPAGRPLVLQLSGAAAPRARLTITRAP